MLEAREQLKENHERDCFLNGQIPTYGTIVQKLPEAQSRLS
jgi:hypothetical protein